MQIINLIRVLYPEYMNNSYNSTITDFLQRKYTCAYEHMKTYSASLVIRGMQIKTQRYISLVRMAKIKSENSKY